MTKTLTLSTYLTPSTVVSCETGRIFKRLSRWQHLSGITRIPPRYFRHDARCVWIRERGPDSVGRVLYPAKPNEFEGSRTSSDLLLLAIQYNHRDGGSNVSRAPIGLYWTIGKR